MTRRFAQRRGATPGNILLCVSAAHLSSGHADTLNWIHPERHVQLWFPAQYRSKMSNSHEYTDVNVTTEDKVNAMRGYKA